MYIAITRAKGNLWIYETTPDLETEIPILRQWINHELVEVIEPESLTAAAISLATVRKSTVNQWKMQGDALHHKNKWRQACFCYERANRPDLKTQTEIERLEKLEEQQQPDHLEIALAFLKADEVAHDVKLIEKAADNLVKSGNYVDAGWLYTALSKVLL